MANSMRKSALHVNNCRNFSAHNLAVVKADPAVVKADPAVAKADPAVAKADPVVAKADPVVAKADPVVVKADPMVVKAGPAVVKVAQVRAGQMRVDPDKAAQVRAAALVDAAASGLPIP